MLTIERLLLEDFKSFAGSVPVELTPGVSVIVGRNGSGKSNLTDALRWVFGEEDLESLRARDWTDLAHRPLDGAGAGPAGPIRVTAVLGEDGAGQEGTGLFEVSREVDRDGRERFSVDGVVCGREQFLELLAARGIEAPLRTVIRQGDVSRLLWLHPDERTRFVVSLLPEFPGPTGHAAAGEAGLGEHDGGLEEARLALEERRREFAWLKSRCRELDAERASLERDEARRRELGRARARLVADLAPRADDPLLGPLLEGLGLADAALPVRSASPTDEQLSEDRRVLRDLGRQAEAEQAPASVAQRLRLCEESLSRMGRELDSLQVRERGALRVHEQLESRRLRNFESLHSRIEDRFRTFFTTLVPGGEVGLPLTPPSHPGVLPGFDVRVRFPQKPVVPLDALSGGQLAVLGLCIALASFLEVAFPALVLDEVEPALDDAMVRRLTRLLEEVGQERQVIAVSHQRLMRYAAHHVLQVERKEGGSRIGIRYDPRLLRGPGAGRAR